MEREPKISSRMEKLSTAKKTIAAIAEHLDGAYAFGDRQIKEAIRQDSWPKITNIVRVFERCGVSGRLPGQIKNIALYGLSLVLPAPHTDAEVEEITLAAAEKVLGSDDYEFYYGLYLQEQATVREDIANTSAAVRADLGKK